MGTINLKQMFKLVISEMKAGLALGLMCGIIAALIGALISYNQPEVARLALAVFIAMVSATLAAPLILHRLDFDPAAASGPFLTMFNDIFGAVVDRLIAMLIL